MTADLIHMLISGERVKIPPEVQPYVVAAHEFFSVSKNQDAYYHSTIFFMECLRTGGDVKKMYDPKYLVDPTKSVVGV